MRNGCAVVYRMEFDTGDPEACERCLEMVDLWVANRNAYRRRVQERHERWREREQRKYGAMDAEDLERQNAFDELPDDGTEHPSEWVAADSRAPRRRNSTPTRG